MILLSMKGFDIAKVWQQIKLNNKDSYFLYDTKKLLAQPALLRPDYDMP